ncbi:MAG TPA: monovalent cation:proton antiporter-2 (CPA2) family protein [Sulfuricella sp.]|nr:monovalent cation:proton antiporter-2 (CPA2) family protein [Sulfuricella sp.]
MHNTLQLVLILLAAAVLVVTLFRSLRLPPLLAYLLAGIVLGPHALGWVPASGETTYLAEFGVVFLMFSIGLEFSLPQLKAMQGIVFGLGGAQVLLTMALVLAASMALGLGWQVGVALGGVLAMSSTAIVSKLLAERVELHTRHGREIVGVLLFQDLAVVPLLVLIPALASGGSHLGWTLAGAFIKAALLLSVLLVFGQRLLRPWLHLVAGRKTSELFMLNVLLVTLGLAYLTDLAGLSLALGAFLAGILISETEYRYQVEADINPFRDVLLGLFFVTIGMMLDLRAVADNLAWVIGLMFLLVAVKAVLIAILSRISGSELSVSIRTGLALAQGGEFGFVLLSLAWGNHLVDARVMQICLSAMLFSMLAAPFIIQYSEAIVRKLCSDEWVNRAREVHEIAVKSATSSEHVIVCGYGRSGQNLARLLEQESIVFIALDHDPERVRAAAVAGESVVYGDAGRREVLMAAGLNRAKALVVTYADVKSSLRVLHHAHEMRPDLPVIVRTLDDTDLEKLRDAGATEVVPEVLEGSLMLASHTLMLLGVPFGRVVKRVRQIREARYSLLRGFFHGATDQDYELSEKVQPRLHTVALHEGSAAVGKTLAELDLDSLLVRVTAVRRHNIRALEPQPETVLQADDVVVLMGAPENLAAAEIKLLQG